MSNLPTFVIYAIHALIYFKYILIFIGAFVEGPILIIACGFMYHLGFFKLPPLYLALVFGDLLGDVAWYYLGYFFAERFIIKYGKFFGLTLETFEKVKSIFYRHHRKIMMLSKLTMGFGLSIYILMVSGASHVKMKTFLIINTIGEFFFVAMLMYLGYSFGKLYNYFQGGFKIGFLIFLGLVVVLFVYNTQKYLRTRMLKL